MTQKTCKGHISFCLFLALAFFVAYPASADTVCDLGQANDPQLQKALENVIAQQELTSATQRGELALSLLVLTDPSKPRLAQINGNKMFYAASLPKIAILLAAALKVDEGRLDLSATLQHDMRDMIRYSCNACANRVLDQVGHNELLAVLQSPRYHFYDLQHGGGLWLGKEFGPKPAYARDPLHGLSHGATTFQVVRFFCALQQGTLASPEQNQLMMDALSKPGIQHKFVKGLASIPGLEIYRKSGTWKTFHADSALVRAGDKVYAMAALSNNKNGANWLERLAKPLHDLATTAPITSSP